MNKFIPKISNRRKFFSTAGKGSLGLVLLSSWPMKLFGRDTNIKKLIEVHPHHDAVKRVK